ncbi:hypothetical protein PHMEG_000417 [Phytophthora megakarya]|uniref:Calmodulin n=1 Tax=Phytophthora megakarya TaxID=4795 RepID=A0A225X5C4_9STRA|nr:hypothetical protein PHMEG_000417 [Phytophthora megakarya]
MSQQQQLYANAGNYATQGGMSTPLHAWVPPSPPEQQYYDMLFAHVDDQRRNAIGGQQAVAFFTRSHLDKAILREVWNIADSQRRSELSRNEFYVAMRLISLAQRGEQVSVQRFFQLAAMQYPLPTMEGVQPPQTMQQQTQAQNQMHASPQDFSSMQQPTASGGYGLTAGEKSKYDVVFQQYDTDRDGFLMGPEAVTLFQMSGLDRNVLRDIWSMADVTQDSKLSVQEFYVAMHLIVCVSKRGLPMPPTLPQELRESAFGSGAVTQSTPGHDGFGSQMSGPPSQNGFPVQQQQETVLPPKAEGMSAFDSLSTVEDAPLPSLESSTPRSTNSLSHADSSIANAHAGLNEPSVPTPTGSFRGEFSAPAAQHDFGSFSAPQAPSVASGTGRERTNSAASMNSMSSFSGMAPLAPHPPAQKPPPRNLDSFKHVQMSQAESAGFQAPSQAYSGFGTENFDASHTSIAGSERPFMSNGEEKNVVAQLDHQSEEVLQALTSVERNQASIEMISEKLRDLDELRHELVALVMKREDLRTSSNSTSAASESSVEEQTRHSLERSLRGLVENQKQVIHQLQRDICRHESELEEAILSAKLQQKLSLESRSPLIDAGSPPLSTNDSIGVDGVANGYIPTPLSLDGSNALTSPVAAPSAPSISAFSPDATDSSGFNAFSNFDSAPRSIPSAIPSPAAGVPSGSPFSPTPSSSQNAVANDSANSFDDFAAQPSMDAMPSSLADVDKSPFSPTPSTTASDITGFDAFGAPPVSADVAAPSSSPTVAGDAPENSPFSPFSPSPSPASTDDHSFGGFGDFNTAPSSSPAAIVDTPDKSPFSPMPSPGAVTSANTVLNSGEIPSESPAAASENSPFSLSPSPAAKTPAFDAFVSAPAPENSVTTSVSTAVVTEDLIFSPVAAVSGSNTFADFGSTSDNAGLSSESTSKEESTGNLLFSPSPSPAAASSSEFDTFGDFSAPHPSAESVAPPVEKSTGNSPFSPVPVDNSDLNSFGDFNAPPASSDSAAPSSAEPPADASGFGEFGDFNAAPASTTPSELSKSVNASGNSPFSPVSAHNSGFGEFGGFNAAPVTTENAATGTSGNSLFSPVTTTDSGFEAFGDFSAAPTSADDTKPKESSDSNGFEAFGDFSAAPSSTSSDFGNFN